jgi:hypothetical protein
VAVQDDENTEAKGTLAHTTVVVDLAPLPDLAKLRRL